MYFSTPCKDFSPPVVINQYFKAVREGAKPLQYDMVDSISLGQEFQATGELKVVEKIVDGTNYVYIAVETKEQIDIPVKNIMGVSSLSSFHTDGEYISESLDGDRLVENKVFAQVVDDFRVDDVYHATDSGFLDFVEYAARTKFFADKVIRYLGVAVRQVIARKDSPFLIYKAGMRRTISKQLWEVRLSPEAILKLQQEEEEKRKREIEIKRRAEEQERLRKEEEARQAQYQYNKRNNHIRDQYLFFDDKLHRYTYNGDVLQSVTNFVENCFPMFDVEYHAKGVAARQGKPTQEIIAMWERKGQESRERGTEMHNKIEKYYQGISSPEDETFRLFKMFASRVILKPYRTEWAVFDEEFKIAGTIDFVDYQNGKYTIFDWKRSDKLVANEMPIKASIYKSKGLYPLEHLEDCPYYHYALQLSLYKFILEKNYNIRVEDLRLGVFHPSYNKPYVLKISYLEEEVNALMRLRSEIVF